MEKEQDCTIDVTKGNILSVLEGARTTAEPKLDQFIEEFNLAFPRECTKITCNVIVWALLEGPIFLYAIGMNTAAITELHAILERFALRELLHLLAKPSAASILSNVLEHMNLPRIAKILHEEFDILNEDDVKYAERLNFLRNGISHRNPRVISNALLSGKKTHILNIDCEVNKVDCAPLIIRGIALLERLFKRQERGKLMSNSVQE